MSEIHENHNEIIARVSYLLDVAIPTIELTSSGNF